VVFLLHNIYASMMKAFDVTIDKVNTAPKVSS
jgi:hypothetical protein